MTKPHLALLGAQLGSQVVVTECAEGRERDGKVRRAEEPAVCLSPPTQTPVGHSECKGAEVVAFKVWATAGENLRAGIKPQVSLALP